jgi:alkanesulfonate monooxygenase SsuD/methylene tetrahydromethanopterin reductase-like flavin-dependent oxidoreductase (luciferase family)
MKIGFKTSQTDVDWPTLLATWELADSDLTVFESGWVFDHFVSLAVDGGSCDEGWTVASALAARTRRLQLGHLVLSNTYRHPALLARMAATLDHVAEGRFVLGLGAGWHEEEHAMYGWEFPLIGERITRVRSAVQVLRAIWDKPDGATLDAPPYRLTDATCHPPPLTPGGPPIWLGTQGKQRGLRIVAEMADGWNHTGEAKTFADKRDALLRHCETVGRDPAEIEISAQAFLRGDDYDTLRETAATFARGGADHLVLIMPARQGPDGLRRLAEQAAVPLREQFG